MSLVDGARERLSESLNAEGRSLGHVAAGVAVCAGLIGLVAAVSVARPQPLAPGDEPERHPLLRAIWPSLFSLTTLAALRVWNAPASARRNRALGFWGVLHAANLILTVWRPTSRGERIAAATTTAVLTAAYAHAAADVDEKAANLAAPTGFAGLAAVIAEPNG